MRPEIEPYLETPGRLPAELVLSVARGEINPKQKIKIWTSSRVLERLGVPWWLPEHRRLLHRIDRVLLELHARGMLSRRPLKQTSRNTREESAYELADQ